MQIWLLSLVTIVCIVIISYLKNSLELEDAEQAYYSQWWRLGYDDQPPFYTWVQKIFVSVFGINKFSFALLRGVLFASVLIFLGQLSDKLVGKPNNQGLLLFMVVLIPVFSDFAFRRLSHTLLMCLMVVFTLLAIIRLLKNRVFFNYVLFGFCIGIGMLSKYSFVLFLVSLGSLVFFETPIRKIFMDKRILVTILIALILNLPHVTWLFSETNFLKMQFSLDAKTTVTTKGFVFVSPIITTSKAYFNLLFPLALVVSIMLLVMKDNILKRIGKNWFFKLFVLQTALIFLLVIVFDINKIETRWLLPLYLPFTLLLQKSINFGKPKFWSKCGVISYSLLLLFQTVRTPFEKVFKIPSSVHNNYNKVTTKVIKHCAEDCLPILPNVTYAGQVYFIYPAKKVIFFDDYSISKNELNFKKYLLVTKNASLLSDDKCFLKDSILGFGKEKDTLRFYSFHGVINVPSHSPFSFTNKARR